MKKQTISTKIKLCFLAALSLVACAKQPVKTQQAMDFSHVGEIGLHINASDNFKPLESLSQTVMNNLTQWDYPVIISHSPNTSHLLTATVGAVVKGSSPTGFSYSAGNSDPRSLEFQKMEILPINCQLKSTIHPDQTSELSMDFMADKSDKVYLASEKLADHISTVCFNLLTAVKWPLKEKQPDQGSILKSSEWIPEVRIEEKVTTDDPITTPVVPTVPASSDEKAIQTPSSQKDTKTEEPKVRIQRDEPRRQIIIHNQGSPVILEFGYERR